MDRREHGAPRHVALAVVGLDAGAAPVLEHEARHLPVAEHRRAVVLEEARERLGQRAGAAARDRPAAPLAAEDDRVRVDPRAGGVHGHERLERLPDHECLNVAVLELAPDHVPGAEIALRRSQMRPRGCSSSISSSDGPKPGGVTRARPKIPLTSSYSRDQAPVRLGVAAREARDLVAGPVEVEPHRELLAVRERHVPDRIGLEVLEPVVGVEAELVVHQQRIHADDRVAGRAGVDPVAGPEQLLGRRAAARDRRARRGRGTRSRPSRGTPR